MSEPSVIPLGIVFLHHQTDEVTLNNLASFRRWNPDAFIVTMSAGAALPGGYSIAEFPKMKEIWDRHTKTGDLRGRSADLLLYAWYLNRREHCERWLIVEWDTYCASSVEVFFQAAWEHDFVAAHVQWPLKNPQWYWWRTHDSLPSHLHRFAAGIVPFSCLLVKDSVLDAVTRIVPWDQLGRCNGELRFATLANACGFPPSQVPSRNQTIEWQPLPQTTELRGGLFHPVKWLADEHAIQKEPDESPGPSERDTPRKLNAPYMSGDEQAFVAGFLSGKTVALEWGSGNSTTWFGARCRKWISVEHDYAWAARVSMTLSPSDSIHLFYAPPDEPVIPVLNDSATYPDYYAGAFESYIRAPGDPALETVCDEDFDVVLIDGRARLFCAEYAIGHPRMKKAVILIHDFRPRKRYWPILDRCRIIGSVESGRSVVALEVV